jgi:hypothetical protein
LLFAWSTLLEFPRDLILQSVLSKVARTLHLGPRHLRVGITKTVDAKMANELSRFGRHPERVL